MLSANTLFHFTPTIDTLSKILNSGFRPSYCRERFSSTGILRDCYVPMVCFCDIPLSQLHNHVNRYGKYGLGMEVEWGAKNEVNPVTYVSDSSSIYSIIEGMQTNFVMALGAQNSTDSSSFDPMGQFEAMLRLSPLLYSTMLLHSYLKPYKGIDLTSGLVTKFYDEKEWRYLPPYSLFPERNPLFLRLPFTGHRMEIKEEMSLSFMESFLKMSIKEALSKGWEAINNHFLTFDSINIKYIVVRYENERRQILASLRANPGKYNEEAIERLSYRILIYEQIKEDF